MRVNYPKLAKNPKQKNERRIRLGGGHQKILSDVPNIVING